MANKIPICPATRHGPTAADYMRRGCRCPDAREAYRLYRKRHREGRQPAGYVDATGTRRRLQALTALGYDQKHLAGRLGISRPAIGYLTGSRTSTVHRATAAAAAELYDELSMRVAPAGFTATYARAVARRNGWPPPLAWDDDTIGDPAARPQCRPADRAGSRTRVDPVAVERAVAGERIWLSEAERVAAVRRLTVARMSDQQISRRLDIEPRSVLRIRAAHGIPAAYDRCGRPIPLPIGGAA